MPACHRAGTCSKATAVQLLILLLLLLLLLAAAA
jgi:hypothetical protein